jgi:cell division transport system permease protein
MPFTLKRIIKLGWTTFRRDGELALATLFILVIAISVVTTLFLSREMSNFLISTLQEKVDVSVYFKESATETEILDLKEELAKMEEIREVDYVSQAQAYKDFVERHEGEEIIMESLEEIGENPFLASLNIKAWKTSQYGTISTFLEHPSFETLIEKVDYFQRKPVIERIFSLTGAVNSIGILFSVILVIVAVLVTFNTIRLAIYNSREEIKIQRLVGAGNWFIRGPFLIQGVMAGIFASFICLAIFGLTSWIVSPKIEFFFPDLNLFNIFTENLGLIFLLQFFAGVSLGIISSLIAIRKYLKV